MCRWRLQSWRLKDLCRQFHKTRLCPKTKPTKVSCGSNSLQKLLAHKTYLSCIYCYIAHTAKFRFMTWLSATTCSYSAELLQTLFYAQSSYRHPFLHKATTDTFSTLRHFFLQSRHFFLHWATADTFFYTELLQTLFSTQSYYRHFFLHTATADTFFLHRATADTFLLHRATADTFFLHRATADTFLLHRATADTFFLHRATADTFFYTELLQTFFTAQSYCRHFCYTELLQTFFSVWSYCRHFFLHRATADIFFLHRATADIFFHRATGYTLFLFISCKMFVFIVTYTIFIFLLQKYIT